MKNIVFLAVALLCTCPSAAHSSVNPSCTDVFGDGWTLSDDTDVFREAERFITKLDEPYIPFVCVGHDDLPSPARTLRGGVSPPWVLYIGIDDRYLRDARSSLRGLMAHEIAHYVFNNPNMCAYYWSIEDYDAYQQCEKGVDRVAALWAGSAEVARGLHAVLSFEIEYFSEDANPRAIPFMEERVHILDHVRK